MQKQPHRMVDGGNRERIELGARLPWMQRVHPELLKAQSPYSTSHIGGIDFALGGPLTVAEDPPSFGILNLTLLTTVCSSRGSPFLD